MKLFLPIVCIFLVCGCTVTNDDIVWSESMCRLNGGLEKIQISGARFQTVTCGNGAIFYRVHDAFR